MTDTRTLSDADKRSLYRDGFVVAKGAVDAGLVAEALARIEAADKGDDLSSAPEMTDLVNRSSLTPILHDVLGRFDPPTGCQIGVRKKGGPEDRFNPLGYRDCDMPYRGSMVHMDGAITISPFQEVQEGTAEEIYHRYFASGPKGDLGRSPEVMGHNLTPMFQDPEMTLGLGSFTCFLFVCLNDQTRPGCGQTVVLPGAHHEVERFFRWQYETNGRLGPEGPGWPRMDHDVPNRAGLRYLPEAIIERFTDETSETTPDGRRWPRPRPVLMEPGDACLAVYQMPHAGSRNELGTESRKSIIFRIRNKRRQPDKVLTGMSDHPDRGWSGEWLDYGPDNDPWERSKRAMCDIWSEWDGMTVTAGGRL